VGEAGFALGVVRAMVEAIRFARWGYRHRRELGEKLQETYSQHAPRLDPRQAHRKAVQGVLYTGTLLLLTVLLLVVLSILATPFVGIVLTLFPGYSLASAVSHRVAKRYSHRFV
jgi:hypothetical protein